MMLYLFDFRADMRKLLFMILLLVARQSINSAEGKKSYSFVFSLSFSNIDCNLGDILI